jgi:adenylate kinase
MVKSGILLIGPNGCGKGTQATDIKEKYRYCHIATGDLLREQIEKGTALGQEAKSLMEAGKLVDDSIVNNMVRSKIASPECDHGFMLDGYPRTVAQAQQLDSVLAKEGWKLNAALHFRCDYNTVMERTGGRLIHKASGRTYHSTFRPPKVAGKDDVTGEDLYQRPDDRPEVVKKRLVEYEAKTAPVVQYYSKLAKNVDAEGDPATVKTDIMAILDGKPAPSSSQIDSAMLSLARKLVWLGEKKQWVQ